MRYRRRNQQGLHNVLNQPPFLWRVWRQHKSSLIRMERILICCLTRTYRSWITKIANLTGISHRGIPPPTPPLLFHLIHCFQSPIHLNHLTLKIFLYLSIHSHHLTRLFNILLATPSAPLKSPTSQPN